MSSNPSSRLILVLGVYRSGTSALTKGLEVFGVSLVDFSETFCDEFNEKGYWEDLEIQRFNVYLLEALSSLEKRQRNILPLTEKESDFLCSEGYLTRAVSLLQKKMKPHKTLALKDPKFSITLPFWKKVFEACHLTASYVITLRPPQSVVASMQACSILFESQDSEKLFWLWISYLWSILYHTQGASRIMIDYEELLKNPSHQLTRLAHALALSVDEDRLKVYQKDFLDTSLFHFQGEEPAESPFSYGEKFARKMYQELLLIAQEKSSFEALQKPFAEWGDTFFSVQSLLALTEKNEYISQQLQETIQKRDHSIKDLNKIIREKLNTIAQLSRALHQHNIAVSSQFFREKLR